MADQVLEWSDVKSFIKRRRKSFFLVFVVIFITSIIIAFMLPSVYRAETNIFIEEQEIPENFVGTTITRYADERLSTIRNQVLSSDRLKNLIEQFDLYPEIRQKHGVGEAIREMRSSIGTETQSADFTNPRTGRTVSATISFVLFYEGRDPETVKDVANAISEFFLEEDARIKEKITAATTGFLATELESLKKQLQTYDKKISEFKQKHLGELPEHNSVNLASISRLERELEGVNMQTRNLQDRKIILEGQIVTIDPLLPIRIDGENVARNPGERLKYLRLKLIGLQSQLHDTHPDINKLKREIRELESQTGATADYQEEIKRLESLRTDLASMESRYGPKHPDVLKISREIKMLEKAVEGKIREGRTRNLSEQIPDNPTYINLKTQISSIDANINNLMDDRQNIQDELSKYRQRVEKTPLVEKEYNELTRDYNLTKQKYDELMNNLMAANVAKGLEEGQHGQRFEIKNYAYLPVKPHKPNRLFIILLGFVLASGSALGLAALQEGLDNSIKSEKELSRLASVPVLGVISNVETQKEKTKRILQRLLWVISFLGFMVLITKIVHEYLMPIDQLWTVFLNNIKNM